MTASHVRPLSLQEVRKLPHLPSAYDTHRVFRLHRAETEGGLTFTLQAETVAPAYHKVYDTGDVDEWLAVYTEQVQPDRIRFWAAPETGAVEALLTWTCLDWNDTIALLDIRVRKNAQRQGYGRMLVRRLITEAHALGRRGISVETQISNVAAIELYRSCGFRIVGLNDHLYSNHDTNDGEVALFLFCETSGPFGH